MFNIPIAANASANSLTTKPMPNTPAIAPGIKLTIADNATIKPVIKPTAIIPFIKFVVSILFKA